MGRFFLSRAGEGRGRSVQLPQILFGLLISCLISTSIFAQARKDFWRDTRIGINYFSSRYTTELCYSSEVHMLACLNAVESALRHLKPRAELLDEVEFLEIKDPPKVVTAFDRLLVVEVPERSSLSVAEIIPWMHAERDKDQDRSRRYYEMRQERKIDFEQIYAWIDREILQKINNPSQIVGGMTNTAIGIVEDPHNRLIPRAELEDMSSGANKSLIGVGIEIRKVEDYILVLRPLPGGPAERAGVRPKDRILAVNGESVQKLEIMDIVDRILGVAGTKVSLRIQRKSDLILDLEIVRERVLLPNTETAMVEGRNQAYTHIKSRSFTEEICDEIRGAVKSSKEKASKGVILDLRGNPGGLLHAAVCVVGSFIPPGQLVVQERPLGNGDVKAQRSQNPIDSEIPLVVLVNSGSASASEIVSGALQDHGRALVIGERSFGKGTVQEVKLFSVSPMLYKAVTRATYHLPSGRSPQIIGITPNLEIFANPEPTDEDRFALREEDLYPGAVPPTDQPWSETRPAFVSEIKTCMENMGTAKTKFQEFTANDLVADFQLLSAVDALDCQWSLK